jgi:complement component 1 Q subcomponent-binding protein
MTRVISRASTARSLSLSRATASSSTLTRAPILNLGPSRVAALSTRATTRSVSDASRKTINDRWFAATNVRGFAADATSGGGSERTLSEALLEERAHEAAAYEPSAIATGGAPEPFKIHEQDGDAEVTLTRKFGDNEEVSITFFAQEEPYDDADFDDDFDDEEDELEDDDLDLDDDDEGIAIDFNVIVSKVDGSAHLDFDCVTDGEIIEIRHISFESYDEENPILGTNYSGPNFEDLEETIQDKFHDYLEERGINSDLASFIVEYHLDKEQREYTSWLEKVSKFVK